MCSPCCEIAEESLRPEETYCHSDTSERSPTDADVINIWEVKWYINDTYHFTFLSRNSYLYYHIYPTPPLEQDMTQGQFLSRV